MEGVDVGWPCQHFSISNPRAEGFDDVPRLLRRVAEEIEFRGLAREHILDVTLRQDETIEGPWWHATVYWATRSR